LKRAYYALSPTPLPGGEGRRGEGELHVLPNIDINIKQGNSLVSRFELDADLSSVFKKSDHSLEDYKEAVRTYKQTGDRTEKARLQGLIDDIKNEYSTTLTNLRPINQKLSKARGRLEIMQSDDLFGDVKFSQKDIAKQKKKLKKLEEQKTEEESGAFFNQAFEWRFEFPEVLDDGGQFTGFDVVIGNPPYVRQEQFKELKPYLKDRYTVYQGTADLYSYFIDLGMDILSDDGHFQYIVANKWMRANYGKPLREWIQNQVNIEAIYDFGDLPVFEEATTYPCLLQLSKKRPKPLFMAANLETLEFDNLDAYLKEYRFESDQTRLQIDGWALIDKQAQKLLDKIKAKGKPLGEYVEGKIYYGIKTGLNEAFVIDEETRERLIGEDSKSEELIKPFLAGKDIKRYQPPSTNKYLILIPSGWTNKKADTDDKWKWFSESYPAIADHFKQFEKKAKKRYDQGEYWWELRPCTYYDEFDKPKIMLPDISLRGNFTMDQEGGFCIVNTAYIIGSNENFLLGILASNLIDFYYRSISSSYRGGYLRFIYQYLETIPIVKPDDEPRNTLESNVQQILDSKNQNPEADTTELEAEIDRLVYELYGLTKNEIKVVEGDQ